MQRRNSLNEAEATLPYGLILIYFKTWILFRSGVDQTEALNSRRLTHTMLYYYLSPRTIQYNTLRYVVKYFILLYNMETSYTILSSYSLHLSNNIILANLGTKCPAE